MHRYLSLSGSIACEADFMFIPEFPPPHDWPEQICKKLISVMCGKDVACLQSHYWWPSVDIPYCWPSLGIPYWWPSVGIPYWWPFVGIPYWWPSVGIVGRSLRMSCVVTLVWLSWCGGTVTHCMSCFSLTHVYGMLQSCHCLCGESHILSCWLWLWPLLGNIAPIKYWYIQRKNWR